ncbi:hypothetical protein PR003_g7417 [Phytophthora rubi]|uniref:BZIP domain-containing protein n=1 Tax=Phytophthora rubi TaxID=129364 RepID=A0A6A3N407_9STRA|nr:hypothetical protein PR002_g5068 [Phytophthora rubi]KAE9041412.1 hypothetical protein PR001_g6629 [Phytophthora rubi]KAE9346459.1 hypothetical protein PR003_g7417 [Phytophthora rubi]
MEEPSSAFLDDEAFLAEVTEFLSDCNACDEIKDGDTTAAGDESLLLASHQLLAEIDAPQDQGTPTKENQSPGHKKYSVSFDKMREIRNTQAAIRRQRYRQKLKNEKETLAQQESELSRELAKLQAAQEEVGASQARRLTLGTWRAIAARQRERRVEAEQKQKLLRAEVVGRSRMIEQMNLLLQDTCRLQQLLACETMPRSGENNGAELFKTFLQEMDGLYAQTNDVLHGLVYKSSVPAAYDLKPKWKDGTMYFDSADRMEFPYAFEEAEDAMTTILMSDPNACLQNASVMESKVTVTMKYHLKYRLTQGKSVDFVIYGAGKKYKENDRLVYLWRGLTEGQGEFDGLQSDETTWIVVRPSRGVETSTILECYSRIVPVNIGMKSTGNNNVEMFVKIVAELGEKESKEMMKMMESLMLNDRNCVFDN